jgi:quinoprotein glucose dehydrogenase
VNIDGGAAADPETGVLYVASQSGLSTIQLKKDPCSEFRYSSPHDSCGLLGAVAAPAGYTPPSGGNRGGDFAARSAGTTIGGVSILKPKQLGGVIAYDLNTGDRKWWIPNGGQQLPVTTKDPLFAGVQLPLSTNGRGQPQVINTKTLVIYGTGRSFQPPGPPKLYAVDKTTGTQVGAVTIPARTTAVPMTFMHQGKQYIVFAIGAADSTKLVGLTLPGK